MKKKFSTYVAIALRVSIITGFIMYGLAVNAQSIVGKWKMTSAKETVTDKASGKTQDLTAQMGDLTKMIEQIIEFHPDNTYYTSNKMVGAKTGFEGSGEYSVAGRQLTLHPTKSNVPVSGAKFSSGPMNNKLPNTMTIVSQTANTLVLHYSATTTDDGKTFTVDIADTFTKQ